MRRRLQARPEYFSSSRFDAALLRILGPDAAWTILHVILKYNLINTSLKKRRFVEALKSIEVRPAWFHNDFWEINGYITFR